MLLRNLWIIGLLIACLSVILLSQGCEEFSKEYSFSPVPSNFNSTNY
ncbi:MAG: hypothetical protein PHE61_04650 [Candidatus Omnitrophica bacterium]|nr:hypothetical protein [Candidatus Omnitrophota bacterium]